jgi:hypothetical protein
VITEVLVLRRFDFDAKSESCVVELVLNSELYEADFRVSETLSKLCGTLRAHG